LYLGEGKKIPLVGYNVRLGL